MKYWKPQGLKIYMGMKAPFGTVGTDDVGPYSAKLNVGKNPFTLRNATDCYYDVTDMQEKLEAVYIQAEDANGKLVIEADCAVSLPEGVTNQTGVSEVTVTIRFSGLKTKEFVVDTIEVVNVPEGMTAEIINANLTVRVRGPEAEISRMTEDDLSAVVDLSAAEAGTATYKAGIKISDEFPNVGAMKTSSVSATVLPKEG